MSGQQSSEEQIIDNMGFTHTVVTKKALYEDKTGNKFVVGIISEITQRKKMEEELRRYSENLEMLIQESPAPIISVSSDERIIIINKSAENLLGYVPGELLDKSLSKILPVGQSLNVADRKNYPMHFVNKMGVDIPVAVSTSIHLFKDRKSGMQEQGMIITLRDLSELQGLSIAPRREAVADATTKAGKLLLEPGYIYLAEEDQPRESIAAFKQLVEYGAQGLVISRQRAEKVKSIYHLERTPHIWLTRNKAPEENCIAPDELSKLNKTVENFVKKAEQGILFFDGMEYLIAQNGFNTALKFLHALNDVIMLCNSLAIWVIDPMALDTRELHVLRRETRSLQPILREVDISREDS